jgi:microcystin-dependent protein
MQRIILAAFGALMFSAAICSGAVAQATEPFLGQTASFAFNFCPIGWAPMNGQLIPITQNQALFSLLGTTYGGDGMRTFALPTARLVPTLTQGGTLLQCIAMQGVFPSKN